MQLHARYANRLKQLVSPVSPTPLQNMRLVAVNRPLAARFSLPDSWWEGENLKNLLHDPQSPLCRNAVAQKYGGHQFGQWNPDLGDGRGLLLGEAEDASGALFDLHLKGAGQTPYSRFADGRAVLRSTLREYLGQEAMHALGIPTSRSLCMMASDETVLRERPEPGAMLIRMAPSHIRFGHIEYFYYAGDTEKLDALIQYSLDTCFPECKERDNPVAAMLEVIVLRTARMIALWQLHGFVHGVMNTDNMSVHGITFDYGPYAFMDTYQPGAVFNHSDYQGRYAFNRQPGIALWNLNALAHALSGHCSVEELTSALQQFEPAYLTLHQQMLCERMGVSTDSAQAKTVVTSFLTMLEQQGQDYTASFRKLALADKAHASSPLRDDFVDRAAFDRWWQEYRDNLTASSAALSGSGENNKLLALNPAVIPRTHLLQEVIDAAHNGDFSVFDQLSEAIENPFKTNFDDTHYARPPAQASAISLSCSS